jgi:hypothetical protein
MSARTQSTLSLVIVVVAMSVIGSIIAIAWYRSFGPPTLDRDAILFIINMVAGFTAGTMLLALLFRYT